VLGPADVPEMSRSSSAPSGAVPAETVEMGNYLGIRFHGELVGDGR